MKLSFREKGARLKRKRSALGISQLLLNVAVRKIAETMEAMFRDAQWKPGFNVLWDGTAI